ncbi:glycosyltransferase family 4 protein [Candidatus Wolfebacteria bacterium]|nr:glycosyltransferase family 4 protein [Candidatus Wolfebacteria bacterium]
MPVLHYPPVLGGFEVFLENIAERIGKTTDVIVLTGQVVGVPREEVRNCLHIHRTASLYSLHDLSYSSYWYIFSSLPVLLFQSLRLIRKEHITLMHANGFFSGLVCAGAHVLSGVPYVITIQSADFTIYHPEVRLNALVWLQEVFERWVYRRAVLCHAVSNDLVSHFKNQGRSDAIMIPNGVETTFFRPVAEDERDSVRTRLGTSPDASMVATISRLEHKNGVHDLIDAVAILFRQHRNICLVIAGDGSQREYLEKKVAARGLTENVLFLGGVPKEEVGSIIASADVFARTPLSEGFGISFLEGMAAGVPVVATPVGGIPDFIEDGVTGVFAEAGNPASIAEAVGRVLTDKKLRAALVANGLKLTQEKYNWDIIAERFYKEVYTRAWQG